MLQQSRRGVICDYCVIAVNKYIPKAHTHPKEYPKESLIGQKFSLTSFLQKTGEGPSIGDNNNKKQKTADDIFEENIDPIDIPEEMAEFDTNVLSLNKKTDKLLIKLDEIFVKVEEKKA